MTDKAWKREERVVAGMFGTTRTPLSGRNSGHNTEADTLHPELYIEVKCRKRLPFWTLWLETKLKAAKEGKALILVLHQNGSPDRAAMVELDFLARTWKSYKALGKMIAVLRGIKADNPDAWSDFLLAADKASASNPNLNFLDTWDAAKDALEGPK